VLDLGDTESLPHFALNHLFFVVASIFFVICILNLFIAGTGTAYDQAQELSPTRFLQERAAICLMCQSRPSLPSLLSFRWLQSCRIRAYCTLMLLSVTAWAGALLLDDWHPVTPSLLFFLASIVGDAFLLQRPEQISPNKDSYLWICHRADHDESSYWPSACSTASDVQGRVSSLKRDARHSQRRITSDILSLRRRIDTLHGTMQRGLKEMGGKIRHVEDDITSRLGRIEELLARGNRTPMQSPRESAAEAQSPMRNMRRGKRPSVSSRGPVEPARSVSSRGPMESARSVSSKVPVNPARRLSNVGLTPQPALAEEPESNGTHS